MRTILFFAMMAVMLNITAQPANDNPCGAIAIPVENTGCEATTVYSYTGATITPGLYGGCINATADNDVWYKITVPSNGQFSFNMAAAPGESQLIIGSWYLDGNCSNQLVPFQSNNGISCFFSLPYTGYAKELTPGSTAYLRIYKPNNSASTSGSFKMCVSNTNALSDEPCNAGFLPVDAADPLSQTCEPTRQFNFTGATLTPSIPNPSCLYSGYYSLVRDVWFKVRVPSSGKINLAIRSDGSWINNSWNILTYNAASCNGPFTELACTQWNGVAVYPLLMSSTFTNLTPNSVLYCRLVANSSAAQPEGQVKICVSEYNTTPTVNNTSKVGIGIDTPFAKLDVVGTGIFRDKITAGKDVEVRGNLIVQGNIIGKYGNTSIQTNTTQSGNLTLKGMISTDSLSFSNRLGNHLSLYGGLGAVPQYGFGIQSGLLQMYSDAAGSNIAFGYGNSNVFNERVRIINQGEYGMILKGRLQLQTGTQSAGLWLNNTANTTGTAFIGMAADNQVGFYGATGAAWGLSMNTTTGNVGIGINGTAAARPLSFPAALGEKILLYPGGVGEVGIGVYGGELRLHCDIPGGKVSFGTQDNAGNFDQTALAQRNGAYAFSVLGSLWVNGTTYASDERFKKNISPIASPLQKLLLLNGVEYEMRAEDFPQNHFTPGRQIGLIAQNVEKVIPDAVNEKDGYKGVDYARLVPLLIESIKELKKEIDALKAQVSH